MSSCFNPNKQKFYAWGTVNPAGESDEYTGLFLTAADIQAVVRDNSLNGLPLKIEHCEPAVGTVITAWANAGKLDVLVEVDKKVLEGDVVTKFIQNKVCQDFSLGYTIGLAFSDAVGAYRPTKKIFNEVSIVRRGARPNTHIRGYTVLGDTTPKA
ncbi:hypothetical protein T484DRAFT_1753452 [Baffinella frigidus]|nr:hypothetical protein T484DRAFT_1753452 [Cryptophyta sp. CCMP2293]